jgi:hypothetical protein
MATKTRATEAPPLPKISDYPPYVQALDKLNQLRAEKGKLQSEEESLLAQWRQFTSGEPEAARLFLETGVDAEADVRERLGKIGRRIRLLDQAIKLQAKEVGRKRREGSSLFVSKLRDHYAAIVRRMVDAVVELGQVAEEEAAFIAALNKNGLGEGVHEVLRRTTIGQARLSIPSQANAFLDAAERYYGIKVDVRRSRDGRPLPDAH